MFILWLVVALLCLIAELSGPGLFVFFSFFLGALLTALISAFIGSLIIQVLVFIVGTLAAFLLIRKWVQISDARASRSNDTNIDALKGEKAVVIQVISPNKFGYVSLYGVLWLSRSFDNDLIDEKKWVKVVDVQGAHLIVEPLSKE